MELNLVGKTAFVCGSTRGIGKASAIELASLGASIVLIARDESALTNVKESLDTAKGQTHSYVCADFSDPIELESKVLEHLTDHPEAHILVNNTGGPKGGPIYDAELDEFESAFSHHLKCNHVLVKCLVPAMKNAGYGRIVNIISTSVKQPLNGLGVSNTIRGAVASWSKTLANELGGFGITVNNVLPGATATQRLESIVQTKAEKSGKSIEEVNNAMLSAIPAKRFAQAIEIATAVAFLSSPAAGYINGINLPVDGGRTSCL